MNLPCLAPHHWLVGAPRVSVCTEAWTGSPTGSLYHTVASHSDQWGLENQAGSKQKKLNRQVKEWLCRRLSQKKYKFVENLVRWDFLPSTSWGVPVEFSLSPGVAPPSLLSVSEVWPAPFLRGSDSASPFSSEMLDFSSVSGLLVGVAAEGKTDGKGPGLQLRGANWRAWSPAGEQTNLGSS